VKALTIIALLIAGCSTASIDSLYQEQAACLSLKGDCADIAKRIEALEKRMIQREYDRARRCPRGAVEYCDQTMKGCGNRHKHPNDQFYCVVTQDFIL
jgi:hypothetical protein